MDEMLKPLRTNRKGPMDALLARAKARESVSMTSTINSSNINSSTFTTNTTLNATLLSERIPPRIVARETSEKILTLLEKTTQLKVHSSAFTGGIFRKERL